MKFDIKTEIINIILKTNGLKNTFTKKHPNSKYTLNEIVNEIIYFLKSGTSYRLLRSKISYKTIHYYYSRFVKFNIFYKLFYKIRSEYLRKYMVSENCILYIDSTTVNNKFGVNKTGRNKFYKNKKSTKISLMTDINGFPLSVLFMKGNYHDNKTFEKHIKDAKILIPKKQLKIIADKAYSSKKNYTLLESQNIEHIIPPRKNMKLCDTYTYNKDDYKNRIKIEQIFGVLKMNRRLSFRYDKYLRNFVGTVHLFLSIIANKIINFSIKNTKKILLSTIT